MNNSCYACYILGYNELHVFHKPLLIWLSVTLYMMTELSKYEGHSLCNGLTCLLPPLTSLRSMYFVKLSLKQPKVLMNYCL